MQTYAGEYRNEAGDVLFMVPVYSRMIGMDTIYVERTTAAGTSGRILSLEVSGDGSKIVQLAYVFQQQNQWRNLRENPELFSALLPKDVRPAGTCDIKLAEDMNSVTYSCGGSPPTDLPAGPAPAGTTDPRRVHGYCVCASIQSSTVPYQKMLLAGFSTQ